MDQREIALINDISETRAVMTKKIVMITNRIHDTILGPKLAADNLIQNLSLAQEAMQATPPLPINGTPPNHPAVAATFEQLQAIFHVLERDQTGSVDYGGERPLNGVCHGQL